MLSQLQDHTSELPENLAKPWPLEVEPVESESVFDLDKALSLVDRDRMDILDTLIRVTLEEEQMLVSDALGVLRSWEHVARANYRKLRVQVNCLVQQIFQRISR